MLLSVAGSVQLVCDRRETFRTEQGAREPTSAAVSIQLVYGCGLNTYLCTYLLSVCVRAPHTSLLPLYLLLTHYFFVHSTKTRAAGECVGVGGLAWPHTQAFSPQCLSLAILTQGRPGKTESCAEMYLDVWRSGTFPEKQQVSECTTGHANMDCRMTSARYQKVLVMFLGFRKPLYSFTEGMCHSSIRPGKSLHCQAFPRVSTASDKRWGRRAGGEGLGTRLRLTY